MPTMARMVLLHLESLSRQITKSDLLALLTSVGGLEPHRVGRIDLRAGAAVIEVPDNWEIPLGQSLGWSNASESPDPGLGRESTGL